MSLIPFILDLADELHEFSRCLANGNDINDFGFGLYTGSEQQQPQQQSQQQQSHQQPSPRRSRTSSFSSFWMPSKRHHPYNRIKSACCGKSVGDEGGVAASPEKDASLVGTPGKTASYSVVNKNGFQVSMNVKQFAPNELSVKTIDNCIVVEGRHDDKEDGHGVISRHFVRKYMLPKGYDPKDVLSTLSSDGILTVKAPPPPPPSAKTDEPNERIVEIQPTPGPTQVVPVVSAKETQPKEQTKKLSSPATRDECQLPEKRQKLDLAQEQQESTEAQKPTTLAPAPAPAPSTPPPPPTPATSSEAAAAAAASPDAVDNEKAEEKTAENDKQQQEEGDGDVETNAAADKVEKQLEKTEGMEIDETDKTVEEEKLPETNGDTNNSSESTEANEPAAESCKDSAKGDDVPAEIVKSEAADANSSKSDTSDKMEVDDVAENNADDEAAVADEAEAKPDAKPKAGAKADGKAGAKAEGKVGAKADGKAGAKADGKTIATETNNTNSTPTKNAKKVEKSNTATSTGELPADASKSAATTTTTNTTTVAESANDEAADKETAVLPKEAATTADVDDVALLKAAVTADASEITAAEENALLSEPMDGITTTDSPSAVECSLFAKSRLGNGNSNSAALVGKEEVAN